MKTNLPRVCMLLACCAPLAGCHSWHVSDVTPQRLILEERPREVRVDVSGQQDPIHLKGPRMEGSSIFGSRPRPFAPDPTVEVPVADVRQVHIRRLDWRKTTAAAVVTTTAVLIIRGLLGSVDWGGNWFDFSGSNVFGCITC